MKIYNITYYLLFGLVGIIMVTACENTAREVPAVSETAISKGWEYRKGGGQQWAWSAANIPGSIHTDLLKGQKIEDPFFRMNEKAQQWIGESDWEYKTTFMVDEPTFQKEHLQLVFEGLDTYADVYLNDEKILAADNMFRTWEIEVKKQIKQGQNTLRVYFHNVFKVNRPKYDNAPYKLQAFRNNDQADVKLNLYSRKAGFHYGWDWGPRLITAGIWRPVKLRSWGGFKIDNAYYRQHKVNAEVAEISAEFEVSSSTEHTAQLTVSHEGKPLGSKEVSLKPGVNEVVIPITIVKPKLWWTNGLGEQPLYTFEATIQSSQGITDKLNTRIGIRSVEVVRDKDRFGKSMYIKLNGVPVFMKGVNYIPQDNFQNRVTQARYEHIITSAKKANMNMLRVWGGGIYENDIFYNLCDENGILVWQDIMFACGMYPADEAFLENVKNEVIDNVTRLRNHPSIALYCGNNENEISWYDWGWKEKYEEDIQKRYEAALKQLFHQTIPDAIAVVDPDRYYHPSSPMAGIGKSRPKEEGDTHYWGVWHGKEPFENFEKNVSRFVSEYGFQSYPEFNSIKKFSIEEDWDLESDVMHAHQRCMADEGKDLDYGNRLINTYLERNFNTPKDFEHYIYTVQALQAKGVKIAVETHRRNRTDNYCMGTMYWQINDCWPAASWSSIDYYGRWKALHYIVKQAYQQVLVTPLEKKGKLGIHIVSDELEPIENAQLDIEVLDFNGDTIWAANEVVTVKPNTSAEYLSLDVAKLIGKQGRKTVYVKMTVSNEAGVLSQNRYFFEADKHLELPKPNMVFALKPSAEGFDLILSAEKLAKYVAISADTDDFFVSDNYFDLDGGTIKTVKVKTKMKERELSKYIKIISLKDSYQQQ